MPATDKASLSRPFECSLCGLCTAVCPERLDLENLFLEMRRAAESVAGRALLEASPADGRQWHSSATDRTIHIAPEGYGFPGNRSPVYSPCTLTLR